MGHWPTGAVCLQHFLHLFFCILHSSPSLLVTHTYIQLHSLFCLSFPSLSVFLSFSLPPSLSLSPLPPSLPHPSTPSFLSSSGGGRDVEVSCWQWSHPASLSLSLSASSSLLLSRLSSPLCSEQLVEACRHLATAVEKLCHTAQVGLSDCYPSIYLYVCLPICLSVCLPICLSACLSVCLSVCLSLSVCLFVCLSLYLPACLFLSPYLPPSLP